MSDDELRREALSTAGRVVAEADQVRAAIVTGSWARGDAHRESDIDIRVIGEGPGKKLLRREGFLVSIGWMEEDEHRAGLEDPEQVASVVPGWRSAVIVHDPDGIAHDIKEDAAAWDWARVEDRCDAWVAQNVTKFAEELQSLVTDLELDLGPAAAAQRSMIATDLAPVLAVHRRLLYETEKELWDEVSDALGSPWREAQLIALGLHDEGFEATCRAAYTMFRVAADETEDLLDDEQRAVVAHACAVAEEKLG